MKRSVYIPNGGCELVIVNGEPKNQCVKVNRQLLITSDNQEPKKNETLTVFMPNGFFYNGEIYLKTRTYAYIYLY